MGLPLSFEFFPPKTDQGRDNLVEVAKELNHFQPEFFSVTYGAGGTTRERTHNLVVRIKQETSLDPVPHLTCARCTHHACSSSPVRGRTNSAHA